MTLENNNPKNEDSKKRTRVTPAQLSTLEETFSLSATPDSKMRKQLAYKLQMPERSIQIWFQNRRAKVKMLQKRAVLRQEQDAIRDQLRTEASYFPNWLPYKKLPVQRAWSTEMAFPPPPPPPTTTTNLLSFNPLFTAVTRSATPTRMESEPILQQHHTGFATSSPGLLLASSVTVGSWHRMKINQQDLLCYYDLNERAFSWHIRDSSYHFKMMIPFDSIAVMDVTVTEDQFSAQIDIDLLEPPIFFMEKNANNCWTQCSDFTEGTQASIVLRHCIHGSATDLLQALTIATQDPKLRLVTNLPSSASHHISATYTDFSNQHWRHQSVPLMTTPRESWIPPTTPYPF